MISSTGNPFGMPDSNPLKQSLEMMSQVWGNIGNPASAAPASPAMSIEELDKRIADLRAIENWLNLNLTMLRGSIQGLEVQRATMSTLRSFAQSMQGAYAPGAADAPASATPSPLEVALGLRPAPAAPLAGDVPPPAGSASTAAPPESMPAANAWWTMLQDQFNRIAAVTTAPAAAAGRETASPAPPRPDTPRKAPPRKRAAAKTAAPRRRSSP